MRMTSHDSIGIQENKESNVFNTIDKREKKHKSRKRTIIRKSIITNEDEPKYIKLYGDPNYVYPSLAY
jgi:hypothetical protein